MGSIKGFGSYAILSKNGVNAYLTFLKYLLLGTLTLQPAVEISIEYLIVGIL